MTVHLLILYPNPKNPAAFDRAYRDEHLPFAGPKLKGALGVATKRVVGPAFAPPPTISCRMSASESRHAESLRDFRRPPGSTPTCIPLMQNAEFSSGALPREISICHRGFLLADGRGAPCNSTLS